MSRRSFRREQAPERRVTIFFVTRASELEAQIYSRLRIRTYQECMKATPESLFSEPHGRRPRPALLLLPLDHDKNKLKAGPSAHPKKGSFQKAFALLLRHSTPR